MKQYIFISLLALFTVIRAEEAIQEFEVDFNNLSHDHFFLEDPNFFNIGNEHLKRKDVDLALQAYQEAINARQLSPQLYYNFGIALEQAGKIDESVASLKKAIEYNDNFKYPRAHAKLAKILQSQNKISDAIFHYQKAVELDPLFIDFSKIIARLLCEQEKFKDSLPYFKKAVADEPDNVPLAFEYANTLNTTGHTEQALKYYMQLHEKRKTDSGILYNIAYTLKKLGRIKDAMPYYDETLKHNPNHIHAKFSLALAYLVTGDFKKGWPLYEWRWHRDTQLAPRTFTQPQWDGKESLAGKTLLIHAEQGLGDTFQFVRYVQVVKEQYKPARIIFAVQKPLYAITQTCCPYIDTTCMLNAIPAQFDYHIPLMTLPLLLDTTVQTVPQNIPYIIPDPLLIEVWRRRLASDHTFKVGICWQGNDKYSTPTLRATVAAKSMPLETLAPLATISNVTLYSLQKETGVDQLSSKTFELKAFDGDFDSTRGRFVDTAAVIKNLDLVITVDTSIAHLAGALGVPVWIMIPNPPDWRWMLETPKTPWYPNMRLFRQDTPQDWPSVIETIRKELVELTTQSNNSMSPVALQTSATKKLSADYAIPESTMTTLNTMRQEYKILTHKINKISAELALIPHSTDNEQFMQKMKILYRLSEIHTSLKANIQALEQDA